MADEIATVERCRHCGCEWVCPDCGGVAGARPPAEVPPIETCACGTVWPANRLPAPAFPAHCPACRPGEWAGAMPFLGERIKPIRRAPAGTLTDAEIDAAEASADAATPGPWEATCERVVETAWTDSDDERLDVCEVLHYGAKGHVGGTAAFIAAARTDVPALARTARAWRRRAEDAERERDESAEALATFDRQILAEKDETRRLRVEVAKLERERDAAKASLRAALDREVAIEPTLRALDAANDAARSSATAAREVREKLRIAARALVSAQAIAVAERALRKADADVRDAHLAHLDAIEHDGGSAEVEREYGRTIDRRNEAEAALRALGIEP